MTPHVIIVNGPPSAGKTSVTNALRNLLPGTVAISGEALRGFAPADVRTHLGGGATYRAGGALARAYLELGAVRVIFDYLCLRTAHFRYFREALPTEIELEIFTLWPTLKVLTEREQLRLLTHPVRGQTPGAADCYHEMARNLDKMGQVLETGELGPEQLASLIHQRCLGSTPHM